MKRGYFGIGVYRPKNRDNIGTLWRSAHNFGAQFIFVIGERYQRQPSDTTKAQRHIPLFHFATFEDLVATKSPEAAFVFVEQTQGAKELASFCHPQQAIYILGAEDDGVPESLMRGHRVTFIDTPICLNVAVAGSIVMFHRQTRQREEA